MGRVAVVISVVALVVALGGTGYAAMKVPRGSVGHAQLRPGAVQTDVVKDGTLLKRDFNVKDLPAGPKGDPGATNVLIRDSAGATAPPGQIGTAGAPPHGGGRAGGGGGSFAGGPHVHHPPGDNPPPLPPGAPRGE